MSKVYKIHPGIGFARVGPSTQGFFLAGESPGAPPVDMDASGLEAAFTGYKDAAKIMRRQGARFRVYEYDSDDATGRLSLAREITAAEATIRWTVSLASAKAAGHKMTAIMGPDGKRTIVPGATDRNVPPPGFTLTDLKASVTLVAEGVNTGPAPGSELVGSILGKELFIGEVRTDASGRLVVLGGRGHAASWMTPASPLLEYLNNPGWYDDIADGSVDATITFAGQAPLEAVGAWVFTTPPDFAPDTSPLTTLFDIAEEVMNIPLPDPITYPQEVEPILRRAANLHFVNTQPVWKLILDDLINLPGLADNEAASKGDRTRARDDLLLAETQMSDFRLTERQRRILDLWIAGTFQPQADATRPPLSLSAELDRASLERCIGGGFFPGIEAGTILRQPSIYSEFSRLTRGTFTDHDGSVHQMEPGLVSARMACPWQADFVECSRNWWPAQRPDITGRNAAGAPIAKWHRGIVVDDSEEDPQSHLNMVSHFSQLGVIVSSPPGFTEIDRDPALDTGA